jgi:glycosyltransferase involved in cell wall biosynthesis
MDELSGFKFAPPELVELETELMLKADVMFTGGNSLYQAKKLKHHNIYSFPSSIDKDHFMSARKDQPEPEDQHHIGHPRLGFFGVLDERFDQELIREVAFSRPDLHFIFIGPVVKIDPADLPRAENIHYLGGKSYSDLPQYLAGWDIAIMPFARNASTRYISPTKTPEYLSGGKPVISTSIHDVVNPYGINDLARIADTAKDFVHAADELLAMDAEARAEWLERVDVFLTDMSWDNTYAAMELLIQECQENKVDHQKFHPYV